ncbi:PCI domain protein [Ostertagia ostertagi]
MSNAVPDPDDVMEADYQNHVADEPLDDFDIDVGNANLEEELQIEKTFQNREGTPVPEDTAPANQNGDMDVTQVSAPKPCPSVVVNNPTAVDVESICQSYKGHSLLIRLQFIADHCPPLKRDATIGMINELHRSSFNVARYSELMTSLETMEKQPDDQNHLETPVLDQAWIDQTTVKSSVQLDFLLAEYKKQKDEGVKESTRRAMDELFNYYITAGDITEALHLYSRGMREYCSQFKHIIQMWTNWMEASIWVGEWQRVDTIAAQAERSIKEAEEAETQANSTAASRTRPVIFGVSSTAARPSGAPKCARSLINTGKARLDAACGLSKLQSGRYKQAADRLLKVDLDALDLPWLFSASDMAMYCTLCVIASYDRTELKKKVISDANCRKFLESEPKLVELLHCIVKSQFGRALDIMRDMKDRFLLDPYLSAHVEPLYAVIRERALLQYLEPFASADLNAMANVFRTDLRGLESELVTLCERGQLSARIDAVGATIRMIRTNEREENYKKIIDGCDDMIERCEAAILRAVMQQACICISSEGRAKRKTVSHADEASDTSNTPTRQKVSVQNMMRVLRGRVVPPLPQGASSPATAHHPPATVAPAPPVPTSANNVSVAPTSENPSPSAASTQQLPNPSEADSSEGSEDPKEPDMS